MKKLIIYSIALLIFNASCEDPLEGNIVPIIKDTRSNASAIGTLVLAPTHWAIPYSTEGKADNDYPIFDNPDTGSEIWVEITNGIVTDVWIEPSNSIAITSSSQMGQLHTITAPSNPIPSSKPRRVALGQIAPHPDYCYSFYGANSQIRVVQPKWKLRVGSRLASAEIGEVQTSNIFKDDCTPTSGEAYVYVPISM